MKSAKPERRAGVRGIISISVLAAGLLLLSPAQAFVASSNLVKPNIAQTSSMSVTPVLFGLRGGFGGGFRGGFGRRLGGGFGGFRRPLFRPGFRPGRPIFRPGRPGFRPGFRPGRPIFRPRRGRRRFFGRRLGGIILGTAIGVAIAGTAPYPPASGLCWYWSDARKKYGYWYYCNEPPY
jgi:hypothetical protein